MKRFFAFFLVSLLLGLSSPGFASPPDGDPTDISAVDIIDSEIIDSETAADSFLSPEFSAAIETVKEARPGSDLAAHCKRACSDSVEYISTLERFEAKWYYLYNWNWCTEASISEIKINAEEDQPPAPVAYTSNKVLFETGRYPDEPSPYQRE